MLLYELLSKNTKLAADVMKNPSEPITTGIDSLDETAGKLNPGEVILVESNDILTRTAFILNFAIKNTTQNKIPIAIFSSVMKTVDLAKQVFMSMDDFQVISKNTPLYIEDANNSSLAEIKERIIKLKESSMIEVVAIDSIDYISAALPSANGQKIAGLYEYIRGIKQIAKEFHLTIILTAQTIDDTKLPKELAVANSLADVLIDISMLD